MNAVAELQQTDIPAPINFSDSAAAKVAQLIEEEGNPDLKLRVFVQGGGCSGFQYGFTFDEIVNEDDTTMSKNGVQLLIDSMSYQYLVGAEIDYKDDLEGAQFVIKNPNATTTCGCGSSFSVFISPWTHRAAGVSGNGQAPPEMPAPASAQFGEGLGRSGDGFLDDGIAVLGRHKAGLEGRRREVHACIQHLVEEAVEAFLVALHHLGIAGRHLGIEVEAEHAADGIGGEAHAGRLGGSGEAIGQLAGLGGQMGVEVRLLDDLQGRHAGRHRHGVARERAGLVDATQRRQMLHHLGAATESGHRQAAADHLAQRRQVGNDAVQFLGAATCHAEARHHFIEDQDGAVFGTQAAHGAQEFIRSTHQVHVARHRFHDHAGNLVAGILEGLFQLGGVVVVQHQGVLGEVFRHPGRGRIAEGQQAAAGLHQQGIGVAVVAAFELDDLVAPGGATGQAQRAHGGFGAGGDQADLFDGGHQLDDLFGHLDFSLGRCTEGQAACGCLLYRLDHFRMGVADDGRAPGADVVDVALAFGIPEPGAFGALDEARGAAYRAEGAYRGIDAARRALLGAGEECCIGLEIAVRQQLAHADALRIGQRGQRELLRFGSGQRHFQVIGQHRGHGRRERAAGTDEGAWQARPGILAHQAGFVEERIGHFLQVGLGIGHQQVFAAHLDDAHRVQLQRIARYRLAPGFGQAGQLSGRTDQHRGLRDQQFADGDQTIVLVFLVGQGADEGIEDQRHVGIVGDDLGNHRDVLDAAQCTDLEGGYGHVFQDHAGLVGDPVDFNDLYVFDAGGVADEQSRHHRQTVAAHGGESGEIGLDARGADRIGCAEAEDEGRSLVLHVE
ncbi:hypothetical protein Lal_00037083 [Lupinus albus]|nr:hypothetical protein Lal_00037083 [Lupinus albus]